MLDNFAEADTEFLSAQIVKYLFKYIIRNYDNYEDINDCNTREGKKRYSDN